MASEKTSPKDVFMQLLGIITLYFSALGFGVLLFQYINIYFPDALSSNYFQIIGYYNAIRWALAILVIVFPVYIWTSWFLSKEEKRIPEKRELRTRKWLLYFTVFAAAGVIIGDLVRLIYKFLQGEMTTRFALKVLTVLVISAAVFGYYLWTLRREKRNADWRIKTLIWTVIAVVAVAVVVGFFIAGSPQAERLRKFDQRRVDDLQNIQNQIIFFWQQKNRLPNTQEELRDSISGYTPPRDPETDAIYEYHLLDTLKFELCAVFKTEVNAKMISTEPRTTSFTGPLEQSTQNENWNHKSGRVCFERTIDPALWKSAK